MGENGNNPLEATLFEKDLSLATGSAKTFVRKKTILPQSHIKRALSELKICEPLNLAIAANPPSKQDGEDDSGAFNRVQALLLKKVNAEAERFLLSVEMPNDERQPWQEALARQRFAAIIASSWRECGESALTRSFSLESTWYKTTALREYVGSNWDHSDASISFGLTLSQECIGIVDLYRKENLMIGSEAEVIDWCTDLITKQSQYLLQQIEDSYGSLRGANKFICLQSLVKQIGNQIRQLWMHQATTIRETIRTADQLALINEFASKNAMKRIEEALQPRLISLSKTMSMALEEAAGIIDDADNIPTNDEVNLDALFTSLAPK